MPLSDQTRIARHAAIPRIVQLWQALAPLQSVVSFMNTGAHPDDETTPMLAALGLRDGLNLSYACATRGEGGQNALGREANAALGVLRTAEMERAADALNMRLYWLSESPDDTILDFGFSKSGVETMAKWGRARTLKRFVDILRLERPDIICPTFLDVPGQHGHHRAMTEAAHLVMDLCGDPDYADSDLPPWQVGKMYLPAWSGAGQSYDDDLPPPPATLTIDARGSDPVTGFSYEQIAQQARVFHASQGMGKWVPAGAERDWPLHLAVSRVSGPDTDIFAGLPRTLRDLGLAQAQNHIDAARAAFPDRAAIGQHATDALAALDAAPPDPAQDHRIRRKRQQLAHVIRIATAVEVIARTAHDVLRPGSQSTVTIEARQGDADAIDVSLDLPDGWSLDGETLVIGDAQVSDPYPWRHLPDAPAAPCLIVRTTALGRVTQSRLPLEFTPVIAPAPSAALDPLSDVVNLASARRGLRIDLHDVPPESRADLRLPQDWLQDRTGTGFAVSLPESVREGRHDLPLTLDGHAAQTVQHIAYDHIAPRAISRTALVRVQVIDAALPDVRVGHIGGDNDRVDHWLARMGMDVTALSDDDIQSDAALAGCDTIVIGIFAMKSRARLAARMPRLHDWCAAGGTLVTLYHRPWDNWDAETTPPKRLEIGQPSLRWRVTDETAEVTHLLPDHPLLTTPNRIGPNDWAGWHKERGLYFAKSWDAAYQPLLEMADPDEAPLQGALLAADIGKGRHVHTSLILHHQMEQLTPGAFRLMANLCARRG